ncbi:MAG: hypothetical protein COV60_01270 [Candidatus Magasanikbacteria bacterium CG11_big_fil_rev_8_21_14_0_20_43_7]|uniref:Uncharacterized protein n=1 Tax=Candidatus Magasanikbacteria bacterium CG11_big_fil_rev_8_21_14_0_20_43_7 TaxID=1974654 RepID=A0A2H0N2Z9_9BACT|nr:MAG: hypothetical protein COV60_01270 [Candidatus Magasanikbacteria bacterium CG11_big_fil_rev_8_21_14_0_20_43_7]
MEEREHTQYTIEIFHHLYDFVCDVLPPSLREEMEHAMDHVGHDTDLSRKDIEDTMIIFGKKVWPYRKALQEIIELHEGKMGDQFFRSILSRTMKKRFEEFLQHGGTLRDIHSGASAHFFSVEERTELNHALVDTHQHLKTYALQHIRALGEREFAQRVQEFADILTKLEAELDHIRTMADDTQEHPMLAREMREHVRGFEHGLCFLGPEYTEEEVYTAKEHFAGRKREYVVRGIHLLTL